MKDLVSVIVPVYNAGTYLAPCLASIENQTYPDLEILLVDDGSTDGSGGLCDKEAARDERIRVIHKENGGLVSAWKAGASAAKGAYFAFVDSDDWLDADYIGRLAEKASGNGAEVICGGFTIERGKGTRPERVTSKALAGVYEGEKLAGLKPELIGHETRRVILSRCMKLTARELFLSNMSYAREDIRMGEDVTVMLPCLLSCERLVLLPDSYGYHYRTVEGSMVHHYNPGLYDNVKRLWKILEEIEADYQVPDGARRAEREFYYLMLLELKNQLRRVGKDADEKRLIRETIVSEIRETDLARIQRENPEKPRESANKLLAMMIRCPNKSAVEAIQRVFQSR